MNQDIISKDPTLRSYLIQTALISLGFLKSAPDNDFGPVSDAAYNDFLSNYDSSALNKSFDSSLKTFLEESALKSLGFYNGNLDNEAGPQFNVAYSKFLLSSGATTSSPTIKIVLPTPIKSTSLTDLRGEYLRTFNSAMVQKVKETDEIVDKITANKDRYQNISNLTGGNIGWWAIAMIHNLECDLDFTQHLFNGDSLKHKTINEPVGQPAGEPPFTFEDSAVAALKYDHLDTLGDWSIAGTLFAQERFNGWGVRLYHNGYTAYLWSGTTAYVKGKYASDGKYDPDSVSQEIGCAAILKRLIDRGIVKF